MVVPQNAAAQAHPGAFEHDAAVVIHHVGAGGDIHLEGIGGDGGEGVVQGVDALKDDDVAGLGVEEPSAAALLLLLLEQIAGHFNGLAPLDGIEMLGQQLHIQAQGGFKIVSAVRGLGVGLLVHRAEVIVQCNDVGLRALGFHQLFQFQGGGGLAGAGGAGYKHDGADGTVLDDALGTFVQLVFVKFITFPQELYRVSSGPLIHFLQQISHKIHLFFPCRCRSLPGC